MVIGVWANNFAARGLMSTTRASPSPATTVTRGVLRLSPRRGSSKRTEHYPRLPHIIEEVCNRYPKRISDSNFTK
jgi:hypothetical protein